MEDLLVKYGAILGKRYTLKQRQRFLLAINQEFSDRGYKTRFANNERKSNARAVDLFIGDIAAANTIICTHHDTPQKALLPNFRYYPLDGKRSFKKNMMATLIPTTLATFIGALAIYYIIKNFQFQGFWQALVLFTAVIVAFLSATLVSRGLSNRYNLNRNTASVLAILQCAKLLDKTGKGKVAFILLDKACGDNSGTLMLKKALPTTMDKKLFIYLDCIADGAITVLAHKQNLTKESERLVKNFTGKQTTEIQEIADGDVIYSPAYFFKRSITISSGNYDKSHNFYVDKVNTGKDRAADIETIDAIGRMLALTFNK